MICISGFALSYAEGIKVVRVRVRPWWKQFSCHGAARGFVLFFSPRACIWTAGVLLTIFSSIQSIFAPSFLGSVVLVLDPLVRSFLWGSSGKNGSNHCCTYCYNCPFSPSKAFYVVIWGKILIMGILIWDRCLQKMLLLLLSFERGLLFPVLLFCQDK